MENFSTYDDQCHYESSTILNLQDELRRTKDMLRDSQIHSDKMKIILKKSLKQIRHLNNQINKKIEKENGKCVKKLQTEKYDIIDTCKIKINKTIIYI